jgi:hypothetical protein
MPKSSLDSSFDITYEENILPGEDIELSSELINLFVDLFGEELLERCSDLSQGLDGSAS